VVWVQLRVPAVVDTLKRRDTGISRRHRYTLGFRLTRARPLPGVFFAWITNLIIFLPMSRSHARPAPHLQLTKVFRRPDLSPHDIQLRMIERDRLAAADTRTEAERWLGDPPPGRSALAQRKQT
jgi:hypothetical protein